MKYCMGDSIVIRNYKEKYTFLFYSLIVVSGALGIFLSFFFGKNFMKEMELLSFFMKIMIGSSVMLVPLILMKEPSKVQEMKKFTFKPSKRICIIEEDNNQYSLYYRRFGRWIYDSSVMAEDSLQVGEKIAELKIKYKIRHFSKPIKVEKKVYWSGRI